MPELSAFRCTSSDRCAFDVFRVEDPALVADDWSVLEETGHATAFQTRAWLDPWLRTVAPAAGTQAVFVLVRDRGTGAPHMLLPLCRRRDGRLDVIEFADLGVSDYNAPLIGAQFAPTPAQFAALWSAIRAALPDADILRIDKSPARVGAAPNPLVGLRFMRKLTLGSWAVSLPAHRAFYERDVICAAFAKELRRKRRRVAEGGPLRFFKAASAEDALRIFGELGAMRGARFASLGRCNILAGRAFRRSYEMLLTQGPDGFANVYALEVGDELVAALFGLRHAETFCFLLSGFRSGAWARRSPGSVTTDLMISQAIAEGVERFDFTIGNTPYKRHFGAGRADLFGGAQALSLRALPHVAERRLKGSLRALLRPPGEPDARPA